MEKIEELIYAAEHGSTEAMYELGMMYYSGDGVAEDEKLAYNWLRRAADKGNQIAEELYRQLNADRKEVYLTKQLGEDYIAKNGKAVVLHCSTCGEACTAPLTPPSNVDYKWVRLAAYSCADFVDSERLKLGMYKVGKKLKICMWYPFYCKIGDTFSVTFGDFYRPSSRFITCQLLGIIKLEDSYAIVSVKVVSEGTYNSFVDNVDEAMKEKLQFTLEYDYTPSWNNKWDSFKYKMKGSRINERLFRCRWGDGGDGVCEDYIYCDDEGIDHLVQCNYRNLHNSECMFGDKVLGYHKYCPIKIDKE